jgi:hypothetical protein
MKNQLKKDVSSEKVFGIGIHKTGTTTLRDMLKLLGYKMCPQVKAYRKVENWIDKDYSTIIEFAKPYEAFQDSPWCFPKFYEKLDNAFINSKFILTIRDSYDWLESYRGQLDKLDYMNSGRKEWLVFGKYTAKDLNKIIYNCLPTNQKSFLKNKDKFLKVYNKHNKDVVSYFKNKYRKDYNKKLLVVNWASGDGWAEILGFVQKRKDDIYHNSPMIWSQKRKERK